MKNEEIISSEQIEEHKLTKKAIDLGFIKIENMRWQYGIYQVKIKNRMDMEITSRWKIFLNWYENKIKQARQDEKVKEATKMFKRVKILEKKLEGYKRRVEFLESEEYGKPIYEMGIEEGKKDLEKARQDEFLKCQKLIKFWKNEAVRLEKKLKKLKSKND